MCIDTILSILIPFRHRQLLCRKNVIIIISIVWGIFIISCVASLVMDISSSLLDHQYYLVHTYAVMRQVLYVITIIGINLTTMIFTLMLYIVALIKVRRRNKIAMLVAERTHHQNNQIYMARSNLKIIKQMAVKFGFFTFCSFLYFSAYLLHAGIYQC